MNPEMHDMIVCPNGLLCVVTGHDKATSWAGCAACPYNTTDKPRVVQYSKGTWRQNMAVYIQDSSVISEYDIDCGAVFVRTMRFALSTRDWVQHILQNEPIDIVAYHFMPTIPIFGLRARYQTYKDRFVEDPTISVAYACTNVSAFHCMRIQALDLNCL